MHLEVKGLQGRMDKIQTHVAAVVITACNHADYLERTIMSILKNGVKSFLFMRAQGTLHISVLLLLDSSHFPDIRMLLLEGTHFLYSM